MTEKKKNRGLGKNLSEMGLAALLGGDWKNPYLDNSKETTDTTAEGQSTPSEHADKPAASSISTEATEHNSHFHSAGIERELAATQQATAAQAQPQTTSAEPAHSTLAQLATTQLQPGRYQPRRHMDDDNLQELAQSIKQQGIVQPLVVRPLTSATKDATVRYEIVAGERRWRAAQLAELAQVPVVVRELDDRTTLAIALIENLQREDLNSIDQAISLQRMLNEFDLTHLELAELVGKSRTTISNLLRLLNLHPEVQKLVQQGDLEMGHGRALLATPSIEQPAIAEHIISQSLTVRQVEKMLQKKAVPPKTQATDISATFKLQQERMQKRLSAHLKCKVLVQTKNQKRGHGKLTIYYQDQRQLENMVASLSGDDSK